jgi:hypothetical protein
MVRIHSSRRILILLTDLHEGHLFKKIMFFIILCGLFQNLCNSMVIKMCDDIAQLSVKYII